MHELLIYAVSHPGALLFAETTRCLGDVVNVPGVGRVVNRAALARAILLDDERFRKTGPGSFGDVITQVLGESALLNMDGEAHRRLRGKLHELFSPAYLRIVEKDVLAPAIGELGEILAAGETVDLVRFTQLLTGRTTCHMLGLSVPEESAVERYLELFRTGRRLTESIRLSTRRLSASRVAAKRVAFEALTEPVAAAYARDDFPERSVLARLRELGLTPDETRGVVTTLLMAGTQTLATAIPRLVALLVDSGQQTLLRAEPGLRQGTIDEGLRFIVPSPVMVRRVHRDAIVDGTHFRAGERVLVLNYNLLKHGGLYPRPRRFDVRREQPAEARNLWFGAGHHYCLGFALAQLQLRLVLDVLAGLPRELRVRGRSYAWRAFLPGYTRLEVAMA